MEKNRHDGTPVPPELWGKDHFSTCLYVESRAVDHCGKPALAHMRTWKNRVRRGWGKDVPASPGGKDYPTRLANGVELHEHDDWDCVEDMVAAGLIEWNGTGLNPLLFPTAAGWLFAGMLRRHIAMASIKGNRSYDGFNTIEAYNHALSAAKE